MEKRDALFDLFRQSGADIHGQELDAVNGGKQVVISTEMDAGMCDDPDGPEPISDCFLDYLIREV